MTTLKLEPDLKPVIDALSELEQDVTVPRNIRSRIGSIIVSLNGSMETPLKINKALDGLEEITDDANIQPYTRTQLWNVISILENSGLR